MIIYSKKSGKCDIGRINDKGDIGKCDIGRLY